MWGDSVKRVAPLRGRPGRGPSPGRRPHRQQRLHRALPADGRGAAHRRRERARASAEICQELGVRQVVETHGHWDHIQAVPALRDAGYEVAVDRRGRRHASRLRPADRGRRGAQRRETCASARSATPGHTPGSTCFLVEGSPLLFSGDTLFPGGPGNTTSRAATSPRSSRRSTNASFGRLPARDDRHARTRRGHDDRRRAPHLEEWVACGVGERTISPIRVVQILYSA